MKPVLVRQWTVPEPCIFCQKETQSLSLYGFIGSCDLVCQPCFEILKKKYDESYQNVEDSKANRVKFLKQYKLHNT